MHDDMGDLEELSDEFEEDLDLRRWKLSLRVLLENHLVAMRSIKKLNLKRDFVDQFSHSMLNCNL